MESLIRLAVIMSVSYRLLNIIITAVIAVAAVFLMISICRGIYDRVMRWMYRK